MSVQEMRYVHAILRTLTTADVEHRVPSELLCVQFLSPF